MPEAGEIAPDFEAQNQDDVNVKLSDLRGKTVVLYFYPKADTPGCTTEACRFRDSQTAFAEAGAVILGVSPDTPKAQKKFATKFDLPFQLIADPDHSIAEQYKVWVEKSMYGRNYMGVDRTTFVVGADGTIKHVYRKVKVNGHSEEVLTAIKQAG